MLYSALFLIFSKYMFLNVLLLFSFENANGIHYKTD